MLSSRSIQTSNGNLPVAVAYPRGVVIKRLLRHFTWRAALVGALAGFAFSSFQHSTGKRKERGPAAMRSVLNDTAVGAAAGGAAGFTGAVAYGWIGGPAGVLAASLSSVLVAAATHEAIPAIAEVPATIAAPPAQEWSLSAVAYSPVFSDTDIKEDAPPSAPVFNGPFNDDIVFLGMNAGPTRRATTQLKRRADVKVIVGSSRQDQVSIGGRNYDLRTAAGVKQFAASLGFDPARTAKIARAFNMCESGARDELAGLAMIWAAGERGRLIPSRLVLAGHSNGDGVWGDNNGSLRLGPLLALSRALPHATAQIEDAFVTGCYSGGEVTMDQYLLIFPRAKTIWAYEAQAPGVDNGATLDQGGWEKATRGRSIRLPSLKSASAGKNLAIWTAQEIGGGRYHANKPALTLDELRGKVQWMEEHFMRPAMQGETFTYDQGYRIPIGITDPHTGLVRQYYSWLVRLTQSKELPEDERSVWVSKKHQTIRLLYYGATVAPRFANSYGTTLKKGYARIGMPCPDFARISRAQALTEVKKYVAKLDNSPRPPLEAERVGVLLERGIRDLDPAIIPDGWV